MKFEEICQITDDRERLEATYTFYEEDTRLNRSKAARVEFLTNMRYIERYLHPSARILDAGAGAGEYSLYLARKGYRVDALELTDVNVRAFQKKIKPDDAINLVQGNAVDLSRYKNEVFDAVLVFGPLYHLRTEEERQKCISEAKRVCKKEGKLYFAFINNDMVVLTELARNADYLVTGDYHKATFELNDFPFFVFHTAAECRSMLQKEGIHLLHEVASDGASELLEEQINAMNEEQYAQYLRYHAYVCEKPEFLGMSNHLLFVGEK